MTLSPLYALEAGRDIYPEFSTGPFQLQACNHLPVEKRGDFNCITPRELDQLLNADPPSAILVGFEHELDLHLLEWARANKYIKINQSFNSGTLYITPLTA